MAQQSVLYIEDNPENRLLVRRTLEASGYSVKEAVDGPSGLKAATESHPDVILLDISLPAMDGYDLARRFSEYAHLDRVPVLAVTANVMKGDKERALGAGCDGYIPKPINIDQLPREIEEALERVGGGDGGADPTKSAAPPAAAIQEEPQSEVRAVPSAPPSREFDPSSLFATDQDDDGGAQVADDQEPDDDAGWSAVVHQDDQAEDEPAQQGDKDVGDAVTVNDARPVKDVAEIPSRASEVDVQAEHGEPDHEVASAVARSERDLSADEELLREVFGTVKRDIGAATEATERGGNGADGGSARDKVDADWAVEMPLPPDEERGVPEEEQSGLASEAEADQDEEASRPEAPAEDTGDADLAAEPGTELLDDELHPDEEVPLEASDAVDDDVPEAIDRESLEESHADAMRVETEVGDAPATEQAAEPEPQSAEPEEREIDGPEPRTSNEREAAVLEVMNGLADEIGAEAVVLMQGPHVLASAGQMRAKRKKELAEILAEGLEASDTVASLLGCERGCREQIVDIGDFSIHAKAIDGDLVLSTAVRSVVPLGAARLWVKRSAARVEGLMGERE